MNQVNNQENSSLSKGIAMLGQVIGLGAAILLTPLLFELTKVKLYLYFARSWGTDIAAILVWVMGGIEAYITYYVVSLVFTAFVIWGITTLAARSFRG